MKDKNTPTSTLEETIFAIEDYIGGNVDGVEIVDYMGLTASLRKQLTSLISEAVNTARKDSLIDFYIHNYQIIDGTPVCSALKRRIELETPNQVEEKHDT